MTKESNNYYFEAMQEKAGLINAFVNWFIRLRY